jgi:hypothetical protein
MTYTLTVAIPEGLKIILRHGSDSRDVAEWFKRQLKEFFGKV